MFIIIMADIYDCIVIGAGVLGSSSAYQLSKDGYKVLLLDQVSQWIKWIIFYKYNNFISEQNGWFSVK